MTVLYDNFTSVIIIAFIRTSTIVNFTLIYVLTVFVFFFIWAESRKTSTLNITRSVIYASIYKTLLKSFLLIEHNLQLNTILRHLWLHPPFSMRHKFAPTVSSGLIHVVKSVCKTRLGGQWHIGRPKWL